ncbi:hypothetical protein [Dactylosporangium sp. NPDC051541]|uniref:hypothetical protein n=1 Tax=Dactylosporangium sp. NPDC051541 TaxID=3363977 RepID=UPI0037873805
MLSRSIVGPLLGATLLALLAGCSVTGGADDTPPAASTSPAGSPPPKATALLAAAVTKTTGVSLKLVLDGGTADEDVSGSYDATHKIGTIAQTTGTDKMTVTVTPDDLYLAGLSDFKGKTMHLKITKLDPKSPLAVFADLLTPLTLLTGVKDAKATAPNTFSGTLDLTKAQATATGAKKFLESVVTIAAAKASAVKFTAAVNAEGYLTDFTATLPGIDDGKDGDYTVKFSDFGAKVSLTKPTGSKVVEAPSAMYTAQ